MTHVYVSMKRDSDGYPPVDVEELDATALGGGRFRIDAIPVFAHGLAVGDVVRVAKAQGDDRYWVYELVESAGHWTVRLLPRNGEDPVAIVSEVARLGVTSHGTSYGLVVVDLPPSADRQRAFEALVAGYEAGRWQVQVGSGDPA